MQYLDVNRASNLKRAESIPVEQYITNLKYVLYDVEKDFIFLCSKKETANPNQVLIGEL